MDSNKTGGNKVDSGKKDQIKGEAKDIKGRVERQAGEWTGNPKTQAKGAADQLSGKAQKTVGAAKAKVADRLKKNEGDGEVAA